MSNLKLALACFCFMASGSLTALALRPFQLSPETACKLAWDEASKIAKAKADAWMVSPDGIEATRKAHLR